MKYHRALPLALCLGLALSVFAQNVDEMTSPDSSSELSVERIVLCTGIENREPVGTSEQFSADVEQVTCFTQISSAAGETSVTHVWSQGDIERARVELSVRAASWRTWSRKRIPSEWSGDWTVTVLDAEGTEIGQATFTVGDSAP